eukprot:RCo051448
MGTEDLDQGDLQGGQLAVHEDPGEVELHLEPHVDVGPVDGGAPPQGETAVGDLVQPTALRVGELLVLHALLETAGLLPEQTLPGGEVRPLEQSVLQDSLHSTQRLDHVRAVVAEVPELAIVALVGPPEGVNLGQLVLLEVHPHPPPLVVRQGVAVLLEERVDPGNAAVPTLLKVLQSKSAVLLIGFLPLQGVLRPHALAVQELRLPGLDVPVQVGDELVLVVAHPGAEEFHPHLGLLGVLQVGLRDQHVTHREHPQPTQLLRGIEDHRGKPRGHLGVKPDLDSGLDLVLALHQQIQKLLGVHRGLAEVRHQADQDGVPLVDDLSERGSPGGHQDLPHAVLELLHAVVVHPQEGLGGAFLGVLVLEVPHAVLRDELLVVAPDLGQDAHLKPAHRKQQVGIVLGVHGDEGVLPQHRGDGAGQPVLDVPEHRAAQVDVVLHQAHALVTRAALLVVVSHDVLVVRIGVLREEAVDEVLALFVGELQQHVDPVDIPVIQPDGVLDLHVDVAEGEEVVGSLRGAGDLAGPGQPQHQQVQHQPVELEYKARKL